MPATITVVAGGARSGKTERMLAAYRGVLAAGPPGVALWLAPTHRAAVGVRERILSARLQGCFDPQCLTFDRFARRVLEASAKEMRPIGLVAQRQILRGLVDEATRAGKLVYFSPIAHSSGFLDLLVGFVQELKRLEIWPVEFQAASGGSRLQKDRELADLYAEYQRILNAHHLYDAQGRFWSARAELRAGQTRPFDAVRHVFVDGFFDFTRTEHEILEILAGRVHSLSISLPLDLQSPREDLFAKSAATLAELRRRHREVTVDEIPRPAVSWPALDHVERYLFANPRQIAAPEPEGIEIVAAAGVAHEIEQLARRIKSLLVEGDNLVKPGDVLVVFRSLADVAEQVREVFGEFGIPVVIGSSAQLERAPVSRALVAWLRLDLDDWPFRQLLSLVVHDYFRPTWPEWHGCRAAWAADQLVRKLQISSGRSSLLAQIEYLATRDRSRSDPAPTLLERQAQLAWPLVRRIGELLDALPERATISVWADEVTALANEVGLLQPIDESRADADQVRADHSAWDQLIRGLNETQRLSSWLGRPAAELSRREFFEHLREVLRSTPLALEAEEPGSVRVLAAESARHVTAPYVFVAGLSERAFPPADRDDCLYSEAETRELVAAGLPLAPRAQRRQHEMLLFYQVVTRATRRLVLSFPALDEAAQPLSPSPYLDEIKRIFSGRTFAGEGSPNLTNVPATDAVFAPRDYRIRAVARAIAGDSKLLARLTANPSTAAVAENILAGLHAAAERAGERGGAFGPFEGMLTAVAARALLGQRYGSQRCWSASQLEQYAQCPYQFFMARVLGLEPIEDPALAIDYAGRGRMLHWLLATLHRRLNERSGGRVSPSELAERPLAEHLEELATQLLARLKTDRPLADGLLEIDVRRLSAALADYWRQHAGYDAASAGWDAPLRPAHFEVSFGPRQGNGPDEAGAALDVDDPLSTREPFALLCGDETVLFAGRIDRIDVGALADRAVFSIIDYKSGRSEGAKAKAILEGLALQLPIYALAAEKLLSAFEAIPVRVGYWHLAGKGCKETIPLHEDKGGQLQPSDEWQSLLRDLPTRVGSLVRGIRRGEFPMASADERCTSRCAYATVCRVNQTRALEKQWQPPREDAP